MNLPQKICTLGIIITTVAITSCVDLSGARLTPEKKIRYTTTVKNTQVPHAHSAHYQGEVHTMLGGLGMFSVGMNTLRNDIARKYPHVSASSNMWYNAGDVTDSIAHYYYTHKKHRPIVLMGHSLGANEQIKVARNLNKLNIPVDLLIIVDAVSQSIIPPNVQHAINIYKPGLVPMFSGLKLRAVNPQVTRIDNINVNDIKEVRVNHFTIDKDNYVQTLIMDEIDKVLVNSANKSA